MAVKTITSFKTLMQYAVALGRAKKLGDPMLIRIAQQNHDDYHQLCLQSNEMSLGCSLDTDA